MSTNSKEKLSSREKLVLSLELKIKNKKAKIDKINSDYKAVIAKEQEELEILVIQYNALKK